MEFRRFAKLFQEKRNKIHDGRIERYMPFMEVFEMGDTGKSRQAKYVKTSPEKYHGTSFRYHRKKLIESLVKEACEDVKTEIRAGKSRT